MQFKIAGNLDFSPVCVRDSDENKGRRSAHIRNKFHRSPFVWLRRWHKWGAAWSHHTANSIYKLHASSDWEFGFGSSRI